MTGFHSVIIFGLTFVLISCKGQIISPPDGTKLTILPGSSENITWNYNEDPPNFAARTWLFTSTDGSHSGASLAQITDGFGLQVRKDVLPRIAITEPSTLSLNNVSQSYDGTYQFNLKIGTRQEVSSNVRVYIAKKPNVIFGCSSPISVIEGGDVTCKCCGEGGRPPANVTWSKKDNQIGGIGKECKTLTLNNVVGTHNGTYKCEARSYVGDDYVDAKYIEVVVRLKFKPINTTIKIKPNQTTVGKDVEITCSSKGVPEPRFTIMHPNGTNITTAITTAEIPYTLENVQKSDKGKYTCIAINERGEDSATGYLNVTETPSTPTPNATSNMTANPTSNSTTSSATGDKGTVSSGGDGDDDSGSGSTNIGAIVGGVCGGLALLAIVAGLVYYFKTKEKDGRNCGNIDPAAGNHYELENEDAGPADNAYDSVGPVGTSSGKSKPPEKKNTLPPVYAAVDKNNRQGNTLYASLDTDAMKPKRESKKEPERTPQTEYASIDFAKRADDNVPKADLV